MSEQPAARDGAMIESVAALLVGEDLAPELDKSKSEPAETKGSQGAPAEPAAIPGKAEGESSLLDGIAAALSGEAEKPAADESGSTGESPPKVDLEINAIASHLGVDVAELYEKLVIPMPDGAEPLTVSALKDQAQNRVEHSLEVEEFHSERDAHRVEMNDARVEIEAVLRLIPEQFRTAEMLTAARSELASTKQREQLALLERIPEWRDSTRRMADLEVIGPHIEKFGFPREMLETVIDHRLFAYVRHNALREQRLEKLMLEAAGKRERKGGNRQPGKRGAPAAKPAASPIVPGTLRGDAAAQVGKILLNSAGAQK
jgi:hypothetical protein